MDADSLALTVEFDKKNWKKKLKNIQHRLLYKIWTGYFEKGVY